MKKKINLHFSVDDVFESLIEVSDKNISLKKHWFFSKFYFLWKKYKLKTGLYLFYEGKISGHLRNLSEVRDISDELKEGWIFFGPHALNFSSPPHKFSTKKQTNHLSKIYDEILRFAGKNYLTKQVRLHEYSESYELKNFFNKKKVLSLFSTDKNIGAHRLPKKNKIELLDLGRTKYKNFEFFRTDFRIELLAQNKNNINQINIKKILDKRNFVTIYTHERELKKKKCIKKLNETIKFLSKNFKLKSLNP